MRITKVDHRWLIDFVGSVIVTENGYWVDVKTDCIEEEMEDIADVLNCKVEIIAQYPDNKYTLEIT